MKLKTWTEKTFDAMMNSVASYTVDGNLSEESTLSDFNVDSLDLLEMVTEMEKELETEFDLSDFNKSLLALPWGELKLALRNELKVNGYLVLMEE